MANYLERVATSAGRRAAVAKPPVSGPPVLPAGRDFSIAPVDPFASDEEQFVETSETPAPLRTESRAEIASTPKSEIFEEATPTRDTTSVEHLEPKPNPRPPFERLSSESPVTIHVPRTLRPISAANVPAPSPSEAPLERHRVRASTTVGPEEFAIGEQPAPIVRSVASDENEQKESVATEPGIIPQPQSPVAEPEQKYQPPVPRQVDHEVTPVPRVDRVDGPARQTAEPSPPPVAPVHVPPVVNNARQEQSRVHIGSLEVLVNNHPRVTTAPPAATPSRTERLSLEKRYLDRFRLRH